MTHTGVRASGTFPDLNPCFVWSLQSKEHQIIRDLKKKKSSAVAVFSCLQPLDWPAKCENLTACVKNTICPGCFEGSSYRFGNQTTFPDSPEKFNVLQKRLFSRRATSCYCCLNLFPSVFSFYNKLSYPGNWLVVFPYLCTHVSVVFITHLNSEK